MDLSRDIGFLNDLLRRAAAAEIMPRFRCLAPGAVRAKSSPLDLVTDADTAAEAMITRELRQRFPGALVVGEEAASADLRLLDGLAEAELAFVIDPIDGTANFAAGLGLFGVMLAVVRRGELVAGIIHDPVADDSAMALRGEGAWTEDAAGGRSPLRVAAAAGLGEMQGSWSWRYFPMAERGSVLAAAARLGAIFDFRCAAHHYRMLAAGNSHFSLYYRLLPWDHAAGSLLHREAGGYGAMLDGRDYRVDVSHCGYLCAPDRDSWREIRALIAG
jgi:fructose-1,6-bisphosphatase/inositol monophosphatase family enzyme